MVGSGVATRYGMSVGRAKTNVGDAIHTKAARLGIGCNGSRPNYVARLSLREEVKAPGAQTCYSSYLSGVSAIP